MKNNALCGALGTLLIGINLQLQPQALAITVTNLNDRGSGSLRQAIADEPVGGTIDFAVTGTIVLTSGQLVITNDLTINGPGAAALTLSQNSTNRILLVSNGIITISGLTIANGKCLGYENGGGIENLATLTVRSSRLTSNAAGGDGGGVFNQGDLTVRDSLIISNLAGLNGGGIANFSGGATTIIGSTICSNSVDPLGNTITAGGIHTYSTRDLVVSNSTVSGNQGGIMNWGGGGGTVIISSSTLEDIQSEGGGNPVVIRNSIIKVCGPGGFKSEDYNLIQVIGEFAPGYPASFVGKTNHNIYGQDPKLGPLADNGGPTPTHALRFDSPAIDAGHSGGAATDQRGLPRPIDDPNRLNAATGDGGDIGAYESDPILKVTGIAATGTEVRVGFNSVLGRNYRLESEGGLDNSWTTISNNIAGTGNAVQKLTTGPSNLPRQFYRVVLLP